MRNLVSFEWLNAHLDDADPIVIDCTNSADWCKAGHRVETVSGRKHWLGTDEQSIQYG